MYMHCLAADSLKKLYWKLIYSCPLGFGGGLLSWDVGGDLSPILFSDGGLLSSETGGDMFPILGSDGGLLSLGIGVYILSLELVVVSIELCTVVNVSKSSL